MLDCLTWPLPAIPQTLYAEPGKPLVERLLKMRKGLEQVFVQHSKSEEDFRDFWFSHLSAFDVVPDEFRFNRMEDELLGQMAVYWAKISACCSSI